MIDLPKTIESIDEDYATPRSTLTYPYLRILTATDALALIVTSLPDGDLPLVMSYKGETRIMKHISKSALVIEKLTRLVDLEYVKSKDESVPLHNGTDILELGVI